MLKVQRGLISFALLIFFSISNLFAYAVSFDQKITVNDSPIADFKVLVQDKNVRTEASYNGMNIVTVRNENGVFHYYPEQKTAQKIPASMIKPNLTDDIANFGAYLEKNKAVVVGSEKVGDKDADIYQYKDETSQADTKVWMWKEKNFPLKIEVASGEGATVVEFNNIQFDPAVDPVSFQIPADVNIMELPDPSAAAAATPAVPETETPAAE